MHEEHAQALQDWLISSEIHLSVLRKDPRGDGWLPTEYRRWVQKDPACRDILEDFVATELEVSDSVRMNGDALFTDRVLKAARTAQVYGAGTDPRYRDWIVTAGYAIAIVLCACFVLEYREVLMSFR